MAASRSRSSRASSRCRTRSAPSAPDGLPAALSRRGRVGAVKALYTAVATATDGGRNGHARTGDGKDDVALSMPESMGGPGGDGTNPEQLFALGYAACFANAMRSVARRAGDESVVDGATVTAHVDIGAIGGGRFGLAVQLEADVPKLGQGEAEGLVAQAHERCPYPNAPRGNIEVGLTVRGGAAVEA